MLRHAFNSLILVGAVSFAILSGCQTIPPISNTTDLTKVDFSNVAKFKRGESCTTLLLGALPFGSSRITHAVRDGHIKSLKVVEYEVRNYIVLNQFCVVAYGE